MREGEEAEAEDEAEGGDENDDGGGDGSGSEVSIRVRIPHAQALANIPDAHIPHTYVNACIHARSARVACGLHRHGR